MEPVIVIKHFDIGDHVGPGFILGFIYDISDPFGFQRVKKAFHYGIVPAVPFATHAANHAVLV
jgi:hypothetical protein